MEAASRNHVFVITQPMRQSSRRIAPFPGCRMPADPSICLADAMAEISFAGARPPHINKLTNPALAASVRPPKP
jgi:hypothetical protein